MDKITDQIIKLYEERNPEYKDKRYSVNAHCLIKPNIIPTLLKCIKLNKFTGAVNKMQNIGSVVLWKISVYDNTLPATAKNRVIDGIDVTVADLPSTIDLAELKHVLEEQQEASEREQLRRSVTETAAERTFKGAFSGENVKVIASHVPLALPTSEGTYSVADKEFFSWFLRDDSNNIYMRLRDNRLIRVPIKDSEDAQVRDESEFWALFWKSYRQNIIDAQNKVIAYAWSLRESIDDADVQEDRLRMKVDPNEKRSIMTMIHQFVPKSWMARMCLTLNFDQVEKQSGEDKQSIRFFKGVNIDLYPRGSVVTNPQPSTDENWQKLLSYAIPKIEISEMCLASKFSDVPNVPAIHRIQTSQWKESLPTKLSEVPHLPPTWSKFFESRLGSQKMSMMYRIAKWLVGSVDAADFSRKVLVISGHGSDGKSLFQNAVMEGLNKLSGTRMCNVLPAEAVTIEGNTQNGLADCLDSRVIMVSDVTKVTDFIKSDVIKAITGGDVITCNIKYCAPIKKSMAGTKIMLCTNSKTYMADTFVDTRVSPVYFERHDTQDGDWNPVEVKAKLVEEFAEFMDWCHKYTYAIESERNIPHSGDQRIWSDGIDVSDVKETWEVIGTEGGGDSMFIYRRSDEESEGEEADLGDVCDDVFEADAESKIAYKEFIPVLKDYCDSKKIKTFNFDKQKYKVMLLKVLQRKFDGVSKYQNHGVRGFIGVKLKSNSGRGVNHYSRPSDPIESSMPAF